MESIDNMIITDKSDSIAKTTYDQLMKCLNGLTNSTNNRNILPQFQRELKLITR